MRTHALRKLATVTCALATLLGGQAVFAADPTAQLSPSRIALDEAAMLRVATDDGRPARAPSVEGLRFHQAGQSSEMTIINGAVSKHTYVEYQVIAAHAGTYAIPVNGQTLQLEVVAEGARGAARASSPGAVAPTTEASAPEASLAFMRVSLPAHKIYVGQSVPITFKAYFRAGTEVTLTGAPSLGIPAFTISQLSDQPRQGVETVGGVQYRVAIWTGQVAAAMPGHYTSNATLPLIARYREASPRPVADPFAGMLDDQDPFNTSALLQSFMNRSAFGGDLFGQVRQRELTLRARTQPLEVAALPTTGQPASFSGAVGHFDVQAILASTSGATSEPLSLKLTVSGHGNFDRVATPGVPSSADWKTYPPAAGATTNGSKIFEQAVVPQTAGRLELPAVSFSFFDPDRGQYVTRSSAPIAVQVAQAVASAQASTRGTLAVAGDQAAVTRLRPNHVDGGRHVARLVSPYERPLFVGALALPLLVLGFLSWRTKDRPMSARARRRGLETVIGAQRAEMKQAADANDSKRYFGAVRMALQTRLGERWHVAPEEVTAVEARNRMGEAGAPIVSALRTAEQLLYGGVAPAIGSLAHYDAVLEQQLDQLEA